MNELGKKKNYSTSGNIFKEIANFVQNFYNFFNPQYFSILKIVFNYGFQASSVLLRFLNFLFLLTLMIFSQGLSFN